MTNAWLRDEPVQRKVTWVAVGTSVAALLVASLILFFYQRFETQRRLLQDLGALATIVAANSTAAVSFGDARVANEVLGALRARRHIVSATIDRDGARFAEFTVSPERAPRDSDLVLEEPIVLDGERLATLTLRYDFAARARELVWASLAGLGGALSVAMVVAYLISSRLHHVITDPILGLASTAQRVADSNDYSMRAPEGGADEIGHLAGAFNDMLGRIESQAASLRQANAEQQRAAEEMARLSGELVAASRRAGQAEVAAGVLHNVGNVLNSVNVSARLLADRLRDSRVDRVRRLARLVREDPAPDRGENARATSLERARYLDLLGERLETERRDLEEETAVLCRSIDHMKVVVAMHQTYAGGGGLVEPVAVDTLCDDALRLGLGDLAAAGLAVGREYGARGIVSIDKHRVLQILVNLVRNARQAIEARADGPKRLVLRTLWRGAERLAVEVEDSGVGIPPAIAERIFAHGFTTRPDGHGFGLHNSAIAAQEMGGSITAASDGEGNGARFTLEIPCARPQEAA